MYNVIEDRYLGSKLYVYIIEKNKNEGYFCIAFILASLLFSAIQ